MIGRSSLLISVHTHNALSCEQIPTILTCTLVIAMSNNSYPTLPADDRFGNSVPTTTAIPSSNAVLVEYRNRLLAVQDRLSGVMAQQAANNATIQGAMGPPPLPAHIAQRAGAHEPNYHSHILPRSSLIPSQSTSNAASSARTEDSSASAQSYRSFPPKFPQNLPPGWLPDTCTTRLNQNLDQIWNAVYRPGVMESTANTLFIPPGMGHDIC